MWEDRIGAIHKVTAGVSTSSSLFVLSLKENRSEENGKKKLTKKTDLMRTMKLESIQKTDLRRTIN